MERSPKDVRRQKARPDLNFFFARALYHDPSVIVLDEATSALDNETERRIVDKLDAMRGGRTLIVIAHRLSTVQKCHKVIMLSEGGVTAEGSYDDVVLNN